VPASRRSCVDCTTVSPEVGEHEQLPASLGWRVSRRLDVNGEAHFDWRCPTCGERARRSRNPPGQSSGSFPAARPSGDDGDKHKENK
jgi:hypothetical protein